MKFLPSGLVLRRYHELAYVQVGLNGLTNHRAIDVNTCRNMMAGNTMTGSSVTVGEVHTGLLHHSTAVSAAKAAQLLDVVPGERALRSDRPDFACHVTVGAHRRRLPAADRQRRAGARRRHGHVAGVADRRPRSAERRLRDRAPRAGRPPPAVVALPGPPGRGPDTDQDEHRSGRPRLPRPRPVTPSTSTSTRSGAARSTRSRTGPASTTGRRSGSAGPGCVSPSSRTPGPSGPLNFTIRGDSVRTLQLTGAAAPIAAQIEFCEDLARHDWLLSASAVHGRAEPDRDRSPDRRHRSTQAGPRPPAAPVDAGRPHRRGAGGRCGGPWRFVPACPGNGRSMSTASATRWRWDCWSRLGRARPKGVTRTWRIATSGDGARAASTRIVVKIAIVGQCSALARSRLSQMLDARTEGQTLLAIGASVSSPASRSWCSS